MTVGAAFVSRPVTKLRRWRDRGAPQPAFPGRVALVAHVFYLDLLPEVLACYANLPANADLLITVPRDLLPEAARRLNDVAGAHLIGVENRGRDIAPFIMLLNEGLLAPYDAVLKLHSKRSPHLLDGDTRRRLLFTMLAGSRRRVASVLAQFEDTSVGMVGWRPSWRAAAAYWMGNQERVHALADRAKLPSFQTPSFFEGSMFWVRPSALVTLGALAITEQDFEPELGQLDATLHHAFERLIPVAVCGAGLVVRDLRGRVLLPAQPAPSSTHMTRPASARNHDARPDLVPAAIVLHRPDLKILDVQLSALDQGGRRLFLFANGPLDPAVERRLLQLSNALVLRSPENVGLGEGLNIVANQAAAEGFEHLLLLDQDSEPAVELPERLAERMLALQRRGVAVAAVGPLLVPPDERFRAIKYQWRDRTTGEALFIPTSGSLVCLAAYAAVGPFRSDYFIGAIDVEWGLRAGQLGYKSLVATDLRMPHRWGSPTQQGGRSDRQILRHSPLRNYYHIRNVVDCISAGQAPLGWRLRSAINLAGQIVRLVSARGLGVETRSVIPTALWDGLSRRLGPAPRSIQEADHRRDTDKALHGRPR